MDNPIISARNRPFLDLDGCKITDTSIEFLREPTRDALNFLEEVFRKFDRCSQWWRGDYLCRRIDMDMAEEAKAKGIEVEAAPDRAGRMQEAVRRYSKGGGYAEHTCAIQMGVASFFPFRRRNGGLSYTHHVEVWAAGLPLEDACEWLDRAQRESWSHRELREAIANAKHAHDLSEPRCEPDIPREVSRMECWAATRWPEMQAIEPKRARYLLGEMRTTVRLVDHLRSIVKIHETT